jgi:chemotaxis family two-component system response regulator Rcp1
MPRPAEILLVEDNPGDVRLTLEVLKEGTCMTSVHHVGDGEQALQFLRREGPFLDAPRPDIVLLDINLPRKNGLELLVDMKSDETLRTIPVVALSTSSTSQEVNTFYALGVNAYIVKPVEFDQFLDVVRSFESFWLSVAALPTG